MTYISYGGDVHEDEYYLLKRVYIEELEGWWSFTPRKFKQLLAYLLANWEQKDRVEYSQYGRLLKRTPYHSVEFEWDGSCFAKADHIIIYGMFRDWSQAEVIEEAYFWGIDHTKTMRKATKPEMGEDSESLSARVEAIDLVRGDDLSQLREQVEQLKRLATE